MRPLKREASALADSSPKKSARPRRDAAMKETPPMKKKGRKPDVVEVEDRLSPGGGPADGPFPSWRRPSPAECFAARDALALLHGEPGAIPSSPPPSSPRPPPPPPLPSREAAAALSAAAATFSDPDGCHSDCLSVLDSLVRTILSQNTTDATSARAFRSLKIALPTWEHARTAKVGIMEEAIRVGGLAEIKAARIRTILEIIRTEALEKKRNGGGGGGGEEKKKGGKEKEDDKKKKKKKASDETTAAGFDFNNSLLSLDYLREWPDAEEIKRELVRFNGVGPKTAGELFISFFPSLFISPPPSLSLSHTHTHAQTYTHTHTPSFTLLNDNKMPACVVLFALKRADFPVDTHIHRIAAALGWTPKSSTREQSYEHLRRRVPATVVHDLHVLLVAHGKVCTRCMSAGRGGGGGGEKCAMRLAVAEAAAAAKEEEAA